MTLDVSIGRIVRHPGYYGEDDIRVPEELIHAEKCRMCCDYEGKQGCLNCDAPEVSRCPDADHDICERQYTRWPREAYRSGSTSFWDFWSKYAPDLYRRMRHYPGSNDCDIAFLQPIIEEIEALPLPHDPIDISRMVWLCYWARVAVDLYGNKAAISFS